MGTVILQNKGCPEKKSIQKYMSHKNLGDKSLLRAREKSARAAILFAKQEAIFDARNTKDKDARWLSTMIRNDTISDRWCRGNCEFEDGICREGEL